MTLGKLMALGLAGTVTVAATVSFTKGNVIDDALTYINTVKQNITRYEENETTLANKITELKNEKLELIAELEILEEDAAANAEEIQDLKDRITAKDNELETAQTTLTEIRNQNTALNREVTRLTNEVNKANSKISELEEPLRDADTGTPLSAEEITAMVDEGIKFNPSTGFNCNYEATNYYNSGHGQITYSYDASSKYYIINIYATYGKTSMEVVFDDGTKDTYELNYQNSTYRQYQKYSTKKVKKIIVNSKEYVFRYR